MDGQWFDRKMDLETETDESVDLMWTERCIWKLRWMRSWIRYARVWKTHSKSWNRVQDMRPLCVARDFQGSSVSRDFALSWLKLWLGAVIHNTGC